MIWQAIYHKKASHGDAYEESIDGGPHYQNIITRAFGANLTALTFGILAN